MCVFKRKDALVAFVERRQDRDFDQAALRAVLATKLEPYAIPTYLRAVDRMPRSENDKLDRAAVMSLFEAEIAPIEAAEALKRARRTS